MCKFSLSTLKAGFVVSKLTSVGKFMVNIQVVDSWAQVYAAGKIFYIPQVLIDADQLSVPWPSHMAEAKGLVEYSAQSRIPM